MKINQTSFIISILSAIIQFSCNSYQNENINPLEELQHIDNLLAEIADKPQLFVIPSDKRTTVTGSEGTIIHVDPERLETVDGSPFGVNIQMELVEMIDNSSLIFNNAQTVSNGQILVTGGAYFLNMSSDGKQLRMKEGRGLQVEFPNKTESEMGLFIGERDSLGQINWIATKDSFITKIVQDAILSKNLDNETYSSLSDTDEIVYFDNVDVDTVSEEIQQQMDSHIKTYEAVELMNFGWINCDKFLNDSGPKIDIELLVNDNSIVASRMYAVFKDINSMMTEQYWKGQKGNPTFSNIPMGKELHIIALSVKDKTPYIFETTINSQTDRQVKVNFVATTHEKIQQKMKSLN